MDGRLNVVQSERFDLHGFRGAMGRGRDCQELAKRECEQMVLANEFEKRN